MDNTLSGYYTKQGKALPSISERAPLFESNGLGKATDYTGTADQNNALLGKLQPNQLINTSSSSRTNFAKNSANLDMMLSKFGLGGTETTNPADPNAKTPTEGADKAIPTLDSTTDPYISALNKMSATSDKSSQILINNIIATKQRRENSLNKDFENYKGGLQLLGIETNQAQATPDLLMGHIQEAETAHHDKLVELDSELAKALTDADLARSDKDFSTLKEKMSYIKELKKAKVDELKSLNDTLSSTQKNAEIEAHEIFDSYNTLEDTDKEAFILAVSKKYKIPPTALIQALVDEKAKREGDAIDLASKKATYNKKINPSSPSNSSGKNYTAANIPDSVSSKLRTDITSGSLSKAQLYDKYPDVSTAYVSALYNSLNSGSDSLVKDIEAAYGGATPTTAPVAPVPVKKTRKSLFGKKQ